jgi:hypothetical protein
VCLSFTQGDLGGWNSFALSCALLCIRRRGRLSAVAPINRYALVMCGGTHRSGLRIPEPYYGCLTLDTTFAMTDLVSQTECGMCLRAARPSLLPAFFRPSVMSAMMDACARFCALSVKSRLVIHVAGGAGETIEVIIFMCHIVSWFLGGHTTDNPV